MPVPAARLAAGPGVLSLLRAAGRRAAGPAGAAAPSARAARGTPPRLFPPHAAGQRRGTSGHVGGAMGASADGDPPGSPYVPQVRRAGGARAGARARRGAPGIGAPAGQRARARGIMTPRGARAGTVARRPAPHARAAAARAATDRSQRLRRGLLHGAATACRAPHATLRAPPPPRHLPTPRSRTPS
jgi:hypothetical protein